jgi:hypothetical protein
MLGAGPPAATTSGGPDAGDAPLRARRKELMVLIEGGVMTDAEELGTSPMRVRKRDGMLEAVDVNKIVRAVARCCVGLDGVDPIRVAQSTISGLCDGATTEELDSLSMRTATALMAEEPNYSRLAARLLATVIGKEVANQDIHSFSQSVAAGHRLGVIGGATAAFVARYARKLNDAVIADRDQLFELFGLRTVYDRYLLRHPETRLVLETPQYFFLRVASGLSSGPDEAIALYGLLSSLEYLPSSPTLFNSGTVHEQMSSCYLVDSPRDELDSIYETYADIARLSKHAGGIGVAFHRVRSRGSLIRGTNGLSNGIVPWLKTLDSSVAAVNQGGRRKGAACVYLETWHADIEEFLELRDSTGDEARRARHINIANWVPDLFMQRVEHDWMWSLFDPKKVPELCDLHGAEFEKAYIEAEERALFERQIPARQLYARMMRTLAETGNGWMTFKDAANRTCNQAAGRSRVVHLSNLCTEIIEVSSDSETAVCNLGLGQPRSPRPRRGIRLRPAGRDRAHGGPVPGPGRRPELLPHQAHGGFQRPVAAGRPRAHGPPGRVLPIEAGFRQRRGRRAIETYQRRGLLSRPLGLDRTGRGLGPPRDLRRDPRRSGPAAVRPLGGQAFRPRPLATSARTHRSFRPAQFVVGGDRAHRHDRRHRRVL